MPVLLCTFAPSLDTQTALFFYLFIFMKETFKTRSYGRKELAQLYSPDISPEGAHLRLKKWIIQSPGLLDKLKETGYADSCRKFTPLQVQLIVNALGEP